MAFVTSPIAFSSGEICLYATFSTSARLSTPGNISPAADGSAQACYSIPVHTCK